MSGLTDMSVFQFNALKDALPTAHNNNENSLSENNGSVLHNNNSNICSLLSSSCNNSSVNNNNNNNNNNNEAILTAALRAHLNYTNHQFNASDLDENELLRTLNKIAICNTNNNINSGNVGLIQKCLPPIAGTNGNWRCDSCNNINYARRLKCNRCTLPRFNTNSNNNINNNNNNMISNNNNMISNNNNMINNNNNIINNNNNMINNIKNNNNNMNNNINNNNDNMNNNNNNMKNNNNNMNNNNMNMNNNNMNINNNNGNSNNNINNNIVLSNFNNLVKNSNKVTQLMGAARNANSEYLNVGDGKNFQMGDLAGAAAAGGVPTSTELLMTNLLNNNSAAVMNFGDTSDDARNNSSISGASINQLLLPNVMLQQHGNYEVNTSTGALDSNPNYDSNGAVGGLCYNNAFISPQLLQTNNISNNNNFSNITSAAHHLLSSFPFLACSPALTPTACSTAMTPHTSTGGISPTTIASPSTVDTILPPTFTLLQIMLLKAKDVADKLLSDFQNLGDLDPLNKAVEVLKTALAMLGHLCDIKNNQSSGEMEDNPLQGIGGPNFSAPTMLAHPDEFKNPSSFLKIYGDPLCSNAVSIAGGNGLSLSCITNLTAVNPVKGQNGNWICKKCSNINFPRRFRCNKCNEYRDSDGDEIVSDYAKTIYHQHLRSYRLLAARKGIDIPLKRFGGSGNSHRNNRNAEKCIERGGISGGNTPVSGNGGNTQPHSLTLSNSDSIKNLINAARTPHNL